MINFITLVLSQAIQNRSLGKSNDFIKPVTSDPFRIFSFTKIVKGTRHLRKKLRLLVDER